MISFGSKRPNLAGQQNQYGSFPNSLDGIASDQLPLGQPNATTAYCVGVAWSNLRLCLDRLDSDWRREPQIPPSSSDMQHRKQSRTTEVVSTFSAQGLEGEAARSP